MASTNKIDLKLNLDFELTPKARLNLIAIRDLIDEILAPTGGSASDRKDPHAGSDSPLPR